MAWPILCDIVNYVKKAQPCTLEQVCETWEDVLSPSWAKEMVDAALANGELRLVDGFLVGGVGTIEDDT